MMNALHKSLIIATLIISTFQALMLIWPTHRLRLKTRMMKTLPKSLTIAFLSLSIFILGPNVDSIGAQDTAAGTDVFRRPMNIVLSRFFKFGRLTSDDGLSNDSVWGIGQDSQGFMWFATLDGLNRYDGNNFKFYRHDPDDPHSLSDNTTREFVSDHTGTIWIGTWSSGLNQFDRSTERFIRYQHNPDDLHTLSNNSIRSMIEDHTGTLWVGTVDGLNKFDRATKQFARYQHDPDNPNSLGGNVIEALYEDHAGILWVSTGAGLDQFDPATERFVHYPHNPDNPRSLSHNVVRSIFEDSSGTIWVGTVAGLNKFDRDTKQFIRYLHDPGDPSSLSHNSIYLVYEDQAGILWVGTWGGGLNMFDRDRETFTHYQSNPADPHSLSNNNVWRIYEDQAGMAWIATDGGGVSIIDRGGKPFRHYRHIPGAPNSLSNNAVRAIYEDREGVFWIGTNSGGLNRLDPQTEQFINYTHDPGDPNSLRSNSVWAIYEDHMRNLWLGGYGSGLIKFNRDTGSFTHYQHDHGKPHTPSNDTIWAIYEDQEGILWIGTNGGGLVRFDRKTERFTRYQHDPADPSTLSHNQVTTIYEDRSGVLWIGTLGGGLDKLDRKNDQFTHYKHNPDDPNSLASNAVFSLYEDPRNRFWIGTMGGGLDKLDRENDQFSHYSIKNGLSSNTVWGILEEDGTLWLSTTWGLSRFNPQMETFRNYDVSDGLQSNSFLATNSYQKSKRGEMFFGGANGFNAFYPEQIVENPQISPIVITDFQLANKPVSIGGDSVLQQSILETNELVLSYLDDVFSFEFAALNYRVPEKNRYKYKMEGFEDDWNEVDSTRRFATYTNLDPGDYVFRVIGSNNDGIWNEEGASIRITVTPPWWETMWFRISLVAASMALLFGVIHLRIRNVEARRRELELQVQKRTQELAAAKEDALKARDAAEIANKAKSDFLANMSHELRTPLNAILGFSEMLAKEDAASNQQEKLAIINRSGQHLLSMINDVLDLSKIEAARIELQEHGFDLVALIKEISMMIQSRATEKGLSMSVEAESIAGLYVRADMGKLRQILINLLSNAVKFTDDGGVIIRYHVDLIPKAPKRCRIVIEVEDTGPGIEPARQAKIFEPFVQGIEVPERKGTGLGLSICKKYADFMGGTIELESKVGKGSLFRVRLPAEIAEAADLKTTVEDKPRVIGLAQTQKTWRILVVDDNRENLLLLKSLLEEVGFVVLEAENGKEAVAAFKKESPDLIWMDMRMPVMDGYEAVRQIRQCSGGDMVPIIAITASAFMEQRDDIMAAGCNDMVIKPFQAHEIFAVMGRLLDIEYIYESKSEAAPAREHEVELTADMLADLPADLLEELRETIIALDSEAIFAVIKRIKPLAPDTAKGLHRLMDNFQTGLIRDLLGENDEK